MESFLQEAQQLAPNGQSIPEPPEATPPVAHNPHAGFDPHAGTNWLYPIDFTSSDYLPLIAEKCLYHNSLVILPNKTEKTFITAVTMYNIYRWYPLGKVIYVASKRVLLDEQKAACEQFMKFLPTDVVDMSMKPHERTRMWLTKRVFFISSTMMLMDINRAVPEGLGMDRVKLIVIDDPQLEPRPNPKIVQKLQEYTKNFRVLCVSTTSGKTVEASLLKSWLISNIELQWGNPHETPEDWLMNKKEISNIHTPLGQSLTALLEELKQVAQPFLHKLQSTKLINKADFERTTVESVQQERTHYLQALMTGVMRKDHHEVMLNYHLLERLLEAHHILEREGIVAMLEYFHRANDRMVQSDPKIMAFLNKLRVGVYNTPHPKFRTLENFLREFYQVRASEGYVDYIASIVFRSVFQRRSDANILIVVERLDAGAIILQSLRQIPESRPKMIAGKGLNETMVMLMIRDTFRLCFRCKPCPGCATVSDRPNQHPDCNDCRRTDADNWENRPDCSVQRNRETARILGSHRPYARCGSRSDCDLHHRRRRRARNDRRNQNPSYVLLRES